MRRDDDLIQNMLSYAEAILFIDHLGRIRAVEGSSPDAPRLASTVTLVSAAAARFGEDLLAGPLDTLMVHFRQRVVMAARTPCGLVAVVAGPGVQAGLLFSHMRRLQASLQQAVAEAS